MMKQLCHSFIINSIKLRELGGKLPFLKFRFCPFLLYFFYYFDDYFQCYYGTMGSTITEKVPNMFEKKTHNQKFTKSIAFLDIVLTDIK